ncbi:MAG: EthD domain-containing protein [Myxococcota bacterium]
MEKLVYLLWKRERDPDNDVLRDRLLADLPTPLASQGAAQIKLAISDGDVAAGAALHLGARRPDALLSFWLECIQDRAPAEALVAGMSGRHAGYLVVESQALRLVTDPRKRGTRTPGFSLVGCIEPKAGVSHAAFIERWETVHRDVAIETQSTFSYVRNEVVRPVTRDAPPWAGIIEEGFPSEALSNPQAFYDAVGDEARYRENLRRMIESCDAFLSMKDVDSHPMSEYRFY